MVPLRASMLLTLRFCPPVLPTMLSVQPLAMTTLGSVTSPVASIVRTFAVLSTLQLPLGGDPAVSPTVVHVAPVPMVTVVLGSGQTEKYGVGYTCAFGTCTTEPQMVPLLPVSAVIVPLLLQAPTPARGEYRLPMTSTALPPTVKLPLVPTLPPVLVCVVPYVPPLLES